MEGDPLVSVLCITFNHAGFIQRTLEGYLAQRTSFPYEVVVHDDASPDGTASIVRAVEERHPNVVRGIYQTENQFTKERGKVTRTVFAAARGKYIAFCEGDDHWIDPQKLQKQVDVLEADPTAVGCFTNAFNERDGERTPFFGSGYSRIPDARVTERDIVLGQGIPTCTLVFRAEALLPLPTELAVSPVGDTILFTHLARAGDLIYIPEVTAVRTMHAGGIHSLSGKLHRVKVQEQVLPMLDRMTQGRYHGEINSRLAKMYRTTWDLAMKKNDLRLARHLWPNLARRRKTMGWGIPTTVRNWFKAWVPAIDRVITMVRG